MKVELTNEGTLNISAETKDEGIRLRAILEKGYCDKDGRKITDKKDITEAAKELIDFIITKNE
jgi:hypothetical protein